jgi:hypothetical protein
MAPTSGSTRRRRRHRIRGRDEEHDPDAKVIVLPSRAINCLATGAPDAELVRFPQELTRRASV